MKLRSSRLPRRSPAHTPSSIWPGSSISEGRLGKAQRQLILESRVQSARALLLAQRRAEQPAEVWFQASATGYYGDRGDETLTERSPSGDGPLSDICRVWEASPKMQAGRGW